jgi:hypothetical protein
MSIFSTYVLTHFTNKNTKDFPKDLGDHPQLHKKVILIISSRTVCVSIEGYPIRVPLPPGTSVADVIDIINSFISYLLQTYRILRLKNIYWVYVYSGYAQ